MYAYLIFKYFLKRETVMKHELLNLLFCHFFKHQIKTYFLIKKWNQLYQLTKIKRMRKLKKLIKLQESSGLKMLLKLYYLSLLKIKKKLEELKYKRGATSNPVNVQLWKNAEKFLLDFNFVQSY